MKNTRKVLGIIALVAVIGFSALSMTGCQEPDNGPIVSSIAIKTQPDKTEYTIGESLDTAGLVITVTFSNGTTEDITSDYTTIGFDSITAGDKNVIVTYKAKTTSFNVKVYPPVVSILVTTQPTKTSYAVGETLSLAGMVVTATLSDGTTREVTGYTNSGFDSDTKGSKTVTVTYQGKTTTFTVIVSDVTAIEVTTLPAKTVYILNETFDATGMVVTGTYVDGSQAPITAEYTTTGFNSTTKGQKTITVTFQGHTATFTVNVYDAAVATPAPSVTQGTYTAEQSVTLSSTTAGADFYYTLDGSTPTTSSTKYTAAISISATTTLKAIGVKAEYGNSNILTAVYTLQAVSPSSDLAAGNYITPQSVTLSTTTTGADIYYTLDGTTPTASSTKYTAAISFSATTTVKAIAIKTGWSNSSVMTVTYNFTYIPLTADTWADGTAASGSTNDKWFKFTATATIQYIQFLPGTSTSVSVQLYEADGTTAVGTSSTLSNTATSVYRGSAASPLTVGNEYYIKVSYSSSAGTYKIAFNETATQPAIDLPTTSATLLTADTWASVTAANTDDLWYKFNATAASHYIHFYTGTVTSVYVYLYDADGRGTGVRTSLSGTTLYYNQTSLTNGNDYYIRVTPTATGAFKIAVNTSTTPPAVTLPTSGVTALTGTWGSVTVNATNNNIGEQWFSFNASGTSSIIQFDPGTITSVYVQLYATTAGGTTGTATGNTSNLSGSTVSLTRTTTSGTSYYVRVTTSSSTTIGAYNLAVTATSAAPGVVIPASPTELNLASGYWANGNITAANGEQWFKFTTSTGETSKIIYFRTGSLTGVTVRLYTMVSGSGLLVGTGTTMSSLTASSNTASRMGLAASTDYYIRVMPSSSTASGTFKIGITLFPPDADVTVMTLAKWASGNIGTTTSGDQWFKFTTGSSAAVIHYIHFDLGPTTGGLRDVNVYLYKSDGNSVSLNTTNLYGSTLYTATSAALTGNTVYYVRVIPYFSTGNGTYNLGYNTSTTLPTAP